MAYWNRAGAVMAELQTWSFKRAAARQRRVSKRGHTQRPMGSGLEPLEQRVLLTAISWLGGTGNWNVAANWSTDTVPNSNDDVTVNVAGSVVNVTDSEQVNSVTTTNGTTLNLASTGTLALDTSSTIGGTLNSSAGGILYATALTLSGTTVLTGTSVSGDNITNSGSLTLNGTALFNVNFTNDGSIIFEGGATLQNSTTLTNAVGATFTLSDLTGISNGNNSTSTLINSGLLTLDGGSGTAGIVGITLEDTGGTISVQSGTLSDEYYAYFQNAVFQVAAGAAFAFDPMSPTNGSNGFYFSGTATGSGGGNVLFNGGEVTGANPDGSLPTSSILDFPAGFAQVTGSAFVSADLGNVNSQITNAGYLDYVGSVAHQNLGMINQGSIDVTGVGDLGVSSLGGFTNDAAGVLNFESDASLVDLGGNTFFLNMGLIEKTGGSNTSSIVNYVDNGGTITAQAGTIDFPAGAAFADTTFNASAGATILFDDPNGTGNGVSYLLSGTLTGGGAGNLIFASNGAVTGNPNTSPATGAVLNFPAGFAQVTGMLFQGGGATEIVNQGYLDYTGSAGHADMALDNKGTIRVVGTGDLADGSNGGFINDTTGVLDFETDAGVTDDGSASFINMGLIEKTGGNGTSTLGTGTNSIGFYNDNGTYDVESGTLSVANGTGSFAFTIPDGGVVAAPGATFNLGAGALGYNIYLQGNLSITGGGSFTHDGGYFQGPNSGYGQTGTGPATLNFTGDQFTVNGGGFGDNVNLVNEGDVDFYSGDLGAILNDGTVTVGAGSIVSSNYFINAPGGVLLFSGTQVVQALGNNGSIQNAGTVAFSPGAGNTFDMSQTEMGNTGTIIFGPGTTILPWVTNQYVQYPELFPNGSGIPSGSTFVLQSGATVTVATSPSITQIAGTVILNSGGSFPAIAGLTTITGQLSVLSGETFTTAGDLTNNGTLSVGGTFTVNGNYTQSAQVDVTSPPTPTLDFEVDAVPKATGAPLFHVTGSTALVGDLTADYVNGFTTAGGAYTVATFATPSTGAFTSTAGTGPFFTPHVSAAQIVLNGTAFTGTGGSNPGGPAIPSGGNGGSGGGGGTGPAVDLSVTSVATPANFVTGQSETLTWTVTNDGANAVTGTWEDSVYLSADGTVDSSSILLGRVMESGPLAAAGDYSATLTVDMPAVAPGSYQVVVVADSRDVLNDTDRANNVAASSPATASVPALTVGDTYTGSITASQEQLFSLTLPADGNTQLAATLADSLEANFYVGFNYVPTPQAYDQAAADPSQASANFLLTTPQAGTYYILVYGRPGLSSGEAFTLTASPLAYGPAAISPTTGANTGQVTLTVDGVGFTPSTAVSLVSAVAGAASIPATSVQYVNANQVYATFDFNNTTPGGYSVMTSEGANGPSATLSGAFTSDALSATGTSGGGASPGQLVYSLSAPTFIRSGAGVLTLYYENAGGSDIPAPIFDIASTNASFLITGQDGSFIPKSIEVLGINPTGPAGTLTPGASGTITIEFQQINTGAHVTSTFNALPIGASITIDWDSLKAGFTPIDTAEDTWTAIYNNFEAMVGTTVGQYQSVLDADETYLGTIGQRTPDVDQLNHYLLEQAGNFGQIDNAYSLSAFGRGQADPINVYVSTDTSGNVTIVGGGGYSIFTPNAGGGYTAEPGDDDTLSLSGAIYTLTQPDGATTVFNANGTVNYFQDASGNRTTATESAMPISFPVQTDNAQGVLVTGTEAYTADLVTTLTAADGETTTLTYNSEGLVTSVADSDGRTVTYTYNPNTEDLLSETGPEGTNTYTYYPGYTHELQTSTNTADVTTTYQYDAFGRLTQTSVGGTDIINYSYDEEGNVGTTDALGSAVETLRGIDGSIVGVLNGTGQRETFTYDAAGALITTTNFDGTQTTFAYEPGAGDITGGDATTVTDADGNSESATYGTIPGLPLTRTDADNNTTTLTYNSAGQVLTTTDPGGATQTNTYTTAGQLTTTTSASGKGVTNTYNAQGLVTSQVFSDGTSNTYTYNSYGKMLTATSAAGTETFTYDPADRLIKVVQPNGLSLAYTYNADGQLASETDQTGFVTNYTYDAAGRLSLLSDGAGNPMAIYTYDAAGNLLSTGLGNGDATTYTYNANGQVLILTNLGPDGTVLSQFTYTYNTAGLVATCTSLAGLTTYTYDADGQLTQALLPGGRTLTFTYDAEGNRKSITDSGTVTNYTTNNLNQYTAVGAATYLYDADGDLISSTDASGTTTYSYDVQGRLTSIAGPSGTTAYQYDALGDIIATTVNGTTTDDLVDPANGGGLAGQFATSGSVIDHYTYGLGLTGQVNASGTASYYAFDASGNTADLTGANGAVVNAYTYLPFGQTLSATGSANNPFTFDGQVGVTTVAGSTSLYMTKARLYDASTGRFTKRDPLGFSGGSSNLYQYAGNDPVNLSDPSGELPVAAPVAAQLFLRIFGFLPLSASDVATAAWLEYSASIPATVPVSAWTLQPAFSPLMGSPLADFPVEFAAEDAFLDVIASAPVVGTQALTATTAVSTGVAGEYLIVSGVAPTVIGVGAAAGGLVVGSVLAVPALYLAYKYNAEHPDGIPVPVQDSLNTTTYQRVLKDPIVQSLINDYKKRNGGAEPDQDTITLYIQIASHDTSNAGQTQTTNLTSFDPNAIIGPAGFGTAGFIAAGQPLPYEIEFTNEASASAPAQIVTVTQQLSSALDLSTFQLGNIGFGATTISVPAGLQTFNTVVSLSGTLSVTVAASLNASTGIVTWTFTSIDPTTGDLTSDPLAGFLPPDVTPPEGEGFVDYTVKANANSPSGTVINAQATVVFDTNAPINTALITNTIDAGAPTSTVAPLAASQASPNFAVSWSGQDDPNGSGIASYTIFVSEDGGAFTPWLTTNATTAVYDGTLGHSYAFYSIATDNVGNTQPIPALPQAQTTVPALNRFVVFSATKKGTYTDAQGNLVTVTLAGPGTGTLGFIGSAPADPLSFIVTGTTTKSSLTIKAAKGTTTLTGVDITGSLNSFSAASADLTASFAITGTLGTLTLGNVDSGPATIDIEGPGGSSTSSSTLTFGTLEDLSLTTAGSIKSLSAVSWTDGPFATDAITATALAKLSVKGAFDASLSLTTGALAATLGSITGGQWTLGGSVQTLTTGTIASSWNGDVAGSVGTVTVKGDLDGSISAQSITSLNVSGNVNAPTITLVGALGTFAAATVTGLALDVGGSIKSVSAVAWSGGSINAASMGSLTTTGLKAKGATPGVAGDFSAGVTLTADVPKKSTLTTLSISGTLSDAVIISAGSIGTATLGAMTDSNIFVGMTAAFLAAAPALPTAATAFADAHAGIGSLTVKGLAPGVASFTQSLIAGAVLGTFKLQVVDTSGTGLFGIAGTGIGSFSYIKSGKALTLTKLVSPTDPRLAADFPDGEFDVAIV